MLWMPLGMMSFVLMSMMGPLGGIQVHCTDQHQKNYNKPTLHKTPALQP